MDDNETYFEMRTSHLSEKEKLQLLHYIDNDEDNVRNIEFWLYERTRKNGDLYD